MKKISLMILLLVLLSFEFILEKIAEFLFFKGLKFNSSKIWPYLKSIEEFRLSYAKYYIISDNGLYAFGEFLARIDIVVKSINLNIIPKKPLKIYLNKKHVPNELFYNMILEKVDVIETPRRFSFKYFKYIFDKIYLLRPALIRLDGKVYHNSDFCPQLLRLSNYSLDWKIPAPYKCNYEKYLSTLFYQGDILKEKIIVLHIPEKRGIHVHRNINDPLKYIPTIKYLIDLGYYIIRIGRDINPPFIGLGDNYIDISKEISKPSGIDVYLLSISYFNILGPSGPNWIYYMFNKPSLLTNTFPLSYTGLLPGDILLPKRVIFKGKLISLREMLKIGLDSPHTPTNLAITCIENSSDEILKAVDEMLKNLSQNKNIITDNQIKYKEIIKNHIGLECGGLISQNFISHHLYLIE